MPDYAKISQGQNEFTDRDPIVLNLHYGQIDRWVSSGKKEEGIKVMKSDNSETIQMGDKVMISETLFMKWLKLTTLIDRTSERRREHHVKSSIKNISFRLGYSDRRGFYKLLKPLYEIGLIDLIETKLNEKNMIDIIVYPHPVYASSNICYLVKCREWEKRNSFGFALSAKGIKAKQEKMLRNKSNEEVENKSTQIPENKSTQGVENKSTQSLENKSTQAPVNKSTLSNDLNISNDSNTPNDSNHLITRLDENTAKSLNSFLNQEKITDEERLMMIDKLIGFEFKSLNYESHQKYFLKILHSIRTQKPKSFAVKKDKLPKWLTEPKKVDQPHEDDPELLEAKRQLEEKMLEFKKRSS